MFLLVNNDISSAANNIFVEMDDLFIAQACIFYLFIQNAHIKNNKIVI
jgi:hypothetical protein